jgi:rsbT antagonist protein RsbS
MPVPILRQSEYLIASVQAALSDSEMLEFQRDLMDSVIRTRSRGVIIDVTGMDVIDSFASRSLRNLSHMTRLRGAETVIVGVQPEVAFSMVQLGMTLDDVRTALDLEEALHYLDQKSARGG